MADDLDWVYTKGSLFTYSSGEYSDHTVSSPFLVLKDFTAREVLEAFKKHCEENSLDNESIYTLKIFLSDPKQGYIEDVEDYGDWFLGSYNVEYDD